MQRKDGSNKHESNKKKKKRRKRRKKKKKRRVLSTLPNDCWLEIFRFWSWHTNFVKGMMVCRNFRSIITNLVLPKQILPIIARIPLVCKGSRHLSNIDSENNPVMNNVWDYLEKKVPKLRNEDWFKHCLKLKIPKYKKKADVKDPTSHYGSDQDGLYIGGLCFHPRDRENLLRCKRIVSIPNFFSGVCLYDGPTDVDKYYTCKVHYPLPSDKGDSKWQMRKYCLCPQTLGIQRASVVDRSRDGRINPPPNRIHYGLKRPCQAVNRNPDFTRNTHLSITYVSYLDEDIGILLEHERSLKHIEDNRSYSKPMIKKERLSYQSKKKKIARLKYNLPRKMIKILQTIIRNILNQINRSRLFRKGKTDSVFMGHLEFCCSWLLRIDPSKTMFYLLVVHLKRSLPFMSGIKFKIMSSRKWCPVSLSIGKCLSTMSKYNFKRMKNFKSFNQELTEKKKAEIKETSNNTLKEEKKWDLKYLRDRGLW